MKTLGMIVWRDESGRKHWAEYAAAEAGSWGHSHGLPHIVRLEISGQDRAANVLKTVLHIATDEDAAGKPVIEKWAVENRCYK